MVSGSLAISDHFAMADRFQRGRHRTGCDYISFQNGNRRIRPAVCYVVAFLSRFDIMILTWAMLVICRRYYVNECFQLHVLLNRHDSYFTYIPLSYTFIFAYVGTNGILQKQVRNVVKGIPWDDHVMSVFVIIW